MLSQKTSPNMDQHPQRQHLRQQSIPTQFEAYHHLPQNFPAHYQQQPHRLHQRGMSLDRQAMSQQYRQMESPQIKQEELERQRVGITNPGQQQPQHYTQVAQPAQARPGQYEISQPRQSSSQELEQLKSLLQQERSKNQRLEHTLLYAPYDPAFAHGMERSRSDQGPYIAPMPEYGAVTMPNGLLAPLHLQTHEQVRRPSTARSDTTGLDGNMSEHNKWQAQMQRPHTRPNRPTDSTPISPEASPFTIHRAIVIPQRSRSPRGTEDMDTDATIKASRTPTTQPALASIFEAEPSTERLDPVATVKHQGRPMLPRGLSHPDITDAQASQGGQELLPSPPNTAPLEYARHFDVAMMPVVMMSDPATVTGQPMYMAHNSASAAAPVHGSPTPVRSHFGGDVAPMIPAGCELFQSSPTQGHSHFAQYASESPGQYATHSRDMSVTSLNLEAVVQDTGISNDEVQQYISKPDEDGKWTCLYPGCTKPPLGRKENVRAHVQTHLGDRQWKCIHCGKDFVRPHDLKRHAKVHSGIKSHPCPCGHMFARHDALTRHRQRNICCGGIGGVIKKTTKRGRPRKERPDDDERANKAASTRRRAAAKKNSAPSESSASAGSRYTGSRLNSPDSFTFDSAEYQPAQAEVYRRTDFDLASFTSKASNSLFVTPPMSPQHGNMSHSPRKAPSTISGFSPASIYHESVYDSPQLPVHDSPSSQGSRSHSHFDSVMSSPPELSHSSPPTSAKAPLFSFDDFVNVDTADTASQSADHQSPSFEDNYASSPEEMFSDSPWREDGFFDFSNSSEPRNFSDSKFTTSFDDEMLFSDAANNDFF